MWHVRSTLALGVGAAIWLAIAALPAAAQQQAAGCGVEPLSLPLFGGTPVADLATPAPAATMATPVADAEIAAALEQIVACVNTNDPKLVYAVFSPGWFARTFADPQEHYLPAFERMLDTSGPVATEPLLLDGIERVETLPDGRVAVVATLRSGDATWRDRLVLTNVDGIWLIDEVEPLASEP